MTDRGACRPHQPPQHSRGRSRTLVGHDRGLARNYGELLLARFTVGTGEAGGTPLRYISSLKELCGNAAISIPVPGCTDLSGAFDANKYKDSNPLGDANIINGLRDLTSSPERHKVDRRFGLEPPHLKMLS
jgi:hypothetical protein